MKEEKEAHVLRQLAAALARDLAKSYQRLAEDVGVSRRTLYRIAPTREALFERLREEAVAANAAAIVAAALDTAPFLQALRCLTAEFVANASLYEFWAADTWGDARFPAAKSASDADLESYNEQMTRFLRRGQADGHIQADVPPEWLLATYDGLLFAATNYRRTSPLDAADIAELVLQTFLRGLSGPRR